MSEQHSTPEPVSSKPDSITEASPALQPPTTAGGKPSKPYPEFPLTAHPAGYWCKKIRGKIHYFGPWSDPDGALRKYDAEKDALQAGRKPREDTGAVTVKQLCNQFLNAKQERVDDGELSPRTWEDYNRAAAEVVSAFGKSRLVEDLGPDDFADLRKRMAKKWGPHRLATTIQCVRCIFRYADDADLIDRPIRYGPGFDRPSAKTMRKHKAEGGAKLFTAEEIRRLIDAGGTQVKAMLLLGINGGFGNSDCANLPVSALDLDSAIIDFPRPKTGIARRCPLWPETIEAIRAALACRPKAKKPEDAGLLFITKYGWSWGKDTSDNPISKEMSKLLKDLGINGRKGLGFYTLRHTFRTIADEAKDQPAADFLMGHEAPHMSSHYREVISDERLRAVVNHVHAWLFPPVKKNKSRGTKAS
jgi:integrase